MQTKIEDVPYATLIERAKAMALDVSPGSTSNSDLVAMVRAAVGGDTIEIDDVVDTVAVQIAKNPDLSHYRHDPKVTVNIASDDQNGGSHPFPIGCNGVPIWLRRDEDVEIPYRFYLALNNAIEKDFEVFVDPVTGQMAEREFERNAIRFTVRNMPSAEEIALFHERTKHIKSGSQRLAA